MKQEQNHRDLRCFEEAVSEKTSSRTMPQICIKNSKTIKNICVYRKKVVSLQRIYQVYYVKNLTFIDYIRR